MEKRVFLAIFLSFVVLALYQTFLAPPPPPPPAGTDPSRAAEAVQQTDPVAEASPAAGLAPVGAITSETPQPAPLSPAPLVADADARDVVVETDSIRAVFTTRGATLRSWRLKKYFDKEGQPLELVPADIPPSFPQPFMLATEDETLSTRLASALFQPSADRLDLGSEPGTLSFQYRDASGLSARKTFHFQPEDRPYVVNVEAAIDVKGALRPVTLKWGPALRRGFNPNGSQEVLSRAIQYRSSVERLDAGDLQSQSRYEGSLRFAGVEDHYFLSVALPGTRTVQVDYQPISLPVPRDPEGRTRTFVAYSIRVPAEAALPFFIGPKDFDILRAVDPQLVRAIDFGIFAWLVVPMLQALKWLNGYIANYGWSIIVLTILINLAIFPLRHRSMVSMRKMQALQPEVKAIQERYSKLKITDPERQKMNQEMMALYKQKGVNPASGCVPMLLTMPVLFAFYAMLSVAIELRGAPFFGWIQDLSERDPLFIWPIVMGATMFWQQRMMPTTADPTQAKIFMFMPVIFTVMFLWAPSGLVIYWMMSNIMAIGQQYITNRTIGPPPVPVKAVRPAMPAARSKS